MGKCGEGVDGGNIFPLTSWELDMENNFRIAFYLALLLWTFMGVAIGADVFMSAIEVITSKTSSITVNGKTFHYKVWNGTIANLTLMALGSSAPEILLSVIEISTGKFYSGALGPSTIVGSAAFNLMVISGICVSSLPKGEGRYVKDVHVFYVTSAFSICAYMWLIIILSVNTPNFVDVTEGLLTLLYFPLLVVLAYGAEKGWFKSQKNALVEPNEYGRIINASGEVDPKVQQHILAKIKQHNRNGKLSLDELRKLISFELGEMQPKSRAHYRVAATRNALGGKLVDKQLPPVRAGISVGFATAEGQVLESQGSVVTKVIRSEPFDKIVSVKFRTVDGTASGGEDFVSQTGILTFKPGEKEKAISVAIIDDSKFEGDETFKIELYEPSSGEVGIGCFTVTIIDDDLPGVFMFDQNGEYRVIESCGKLIATVQRHNGSTGAVTVKYRTKDGTGSNKAVAGHDYEEIFGLLEFSDGETCKSIEVTICDDANPEKDEVFTIELFEPTGGATFQEPEDEVLLATVTIENDEKMHTLKNFFADLVNTDTVALGTANWKEQFEAALSPVGGVPLEEGQTIPTSLWITHTLSLPWKLFFAFIPPTDYCGGWVCFVVALVLIGVVTMIIGDIATLFGCVLGIEPSITAITFVALGTSLPDTFASKTAAQQDRYADASIGNITGSNSVNVFLGLGLPWFMAALYWGNANEALQKEWRGRYEKETWYTPGMTVGFAVPAGDLSFSVAVFSFCAVSTLGFLMLRRKRLGYELGMAYEKPTTAFFIGLWFFYVTASVLKTEKMI